MASTGSTAAASTVWVAPKRRAHSSLRASMSTAMIVRAPARADAAMAASPTPPQPNTATVSPRPTPPVLTAAPKPAMTPQPIRPAASGRAAGSTFTAWPAATRVFSAKAPMPRAGESGVPSEQGHGLGRVGAVEAVPRPAPPAGPAQPARGPPGQHHVVARRHVGHPLPDRLDRAGRFVAEQEGEVVVDGPLAVVEVGVADPAGAHGDDGLARTRVGHHHRLERDRRPFLRSDDAAHFVGHGADARRPAAPGRRSAMSSTWGRMACCQGRLVGHVGVGGADPAAPARPGRRSSARPTQAATSAPKPLVSTSSWTTSSRPVRATSVATSSWSHGSSERRSMTWTELPSSAARVAAACRDFSTSGAPGDDGELVAVDRDPAPAERDLELPGREGIPGVGLAQQVLVLEEQHRVLGLQGRPQQPDGVGGPGRHDHGEAGDVGEDGLAGLRVPDGPAGHVAADRHPQHHRAAERPVGAPADGGRLALDLVHGRPDVVEELHLGHRPQPPQALAHGPARRCWPRPAACCSSGPGRSAAAARRWCRTRRPCPRRWPARPRGRRRRPRRTPGCARPPPSAPARVRRMASPRATTSPWPSSASPRSRPGSTYGRATTWSVTVAGSGRGAARARRAAAEHRLAGLLLDGGHLVGRQDPALEEGLLHQHERDRGRPRRPAPPASGTCSGCPARSGSRAGSRWRG